MIRILTAILTLCLASATAQEEEVVRVDLMPVCIGQQTTLFYRSKGKVMKLEAFESAMGTPVFYRGSRILNLYETEADAQPRKEGEEVVPPTAIVRLPAGASRVLLLFTSNDGDPLDARAFGIDDNDLRAGDYRIFNMTGLPVAMKFGEKAFAIGSGATVDHNDASLRETGTDLEVIIGFRYEGETKVAYSTIWGHYPLRRTYVLVLPSEDASRPLDIRKFHDVPSVQSLGYEPEER